MKTKRKFEAVELSKAVWKVKDVVEAPVKEWSIVKRASPYLSGSKTCQLLRGRENDYLQGEKKLAEQTVGTSVEMPPKKQISIEEQ